MIIKCESCNAKFKLNEDRIKGKGARVRCKKCGDYIIVMKPGYEHLKSLFVDSIKEKETREKGETPAAEPPPESEAREEEPAPEPPPQPAEETAQPSPEEPKAAEPRLEVGKDFETPGEPSLYTDAELPGLEPGIPPSGAIDESMVPAEAEGITETEKEEKDEIDKAFEQYLESMKLESEEESLRVEETQPEEERAEPEEEKMNGILSTTETLEFLSETEKSEESKPTEEADFDLKIEDEKLDLGGALDFSSVIQEKPEPTPDTTEAPSPDLPPPPPEPEIPSFVSGEKPDAPEERPSEEAEETTKRETREPSRAEPSPYEVVPRKIIQKKKKKAFAGKLLLLILVLLLVVAAGGAFLAFTEKGNEILLSYAPQIRSIFGIKEAVKGPKFKITNLIGYYEDNKKAGKIFVIKGEIINLTKTAKSGLMVKGELLDKKGELIAEKTVYAGNPLTSEKLKTASRFEIDNALNNKLGKNLSNIDVQPGSSVPFMIVFFDLKGEVEAYRVECTD